MKNHPAHKYGNDAVQKTTGVTIPPVLSSRSHVRLRAHDDFNSAVGYTACQRNTAKPADTKNNNPIVMALLGSVMSKAMGGKKE